MNNKDMQKLKPGTLLEILPFYVIENNGKEIERGAYHFDIVDNGTSSPGHPGPGPCLGMIKEETVVMFVKPLSSVTATILHEGRLSAIHASGVNTIKEKS